MITKRLFYLFTFLWSAAIAYGQTNLTTLVVTAGQAHALALRSDGSVWAWGTNRDGELGLGTNNLVSAPQRVANVTNVISVSAGALHSLAVQSSGMVWAWGLNSDGRLGNGTFTTSTNPVPVSRITNAVMVAAGGSHSLAVLANGQVMAWGSNLGGQLGTGNTISTNQPVQAGSFTNVITVVAGTNFSLALTANGNVWSWGTNNLGQLGLGSTTGQLSPVQITTLSNIVQITAGGSHCLAVNNSGVVYAWGRNAEGQLGDGTTVNATAPEVVPNFGSATNLGAVQWIAAAYNSSAAVLKTGRLFFWGWYGNGSAYGSNTPPQELNANSGLSFQKVAYGDSYLLATLADNSTWAWGFNQFSQWGNGNNYSTNDFWSYDSVAAEFSFSASPYQQMTRFNCGDRYDMNLYAPYSYDLPYNTFVLPLDLEQGVKLATFGNDLYCYGASTPWFLKVQKTQRQHIWQLVGSTTNVTRFPVDNPVVAFGNDAGGSPLYVGQAYNFGVFAGFYDERTSQTNRFRILVYDRSVLASGATNVAPTNIINIPLPRRYVAADSGAWSNLVTNGNRVVIATNGLITQVQFREGQGWGGNWGLGLTLGSTLTNVDIDGYTITVTALTTNYCYVVEGIGSAEVGANVFAPMGITNNTGWAYLPLYAMSFDTPSPLLAHFINNPHYLGTPAPPTYAGRSQAELHGLTAVMTNNIWLTNNPAYTNLDNSPELRRSPILDQFVSDMGNNPLALANYVINQIGFTDPMGDQTSSQLVNDSIVLGGVNRSAQATFLEGQGSPTEQCALLVYLLRQAGYPAAYVWPTNNNLMLMANTVSGLWKVNVQSVVYYAGEPLITNALITVNYPWVVANIGTNTVQIFPWLKNTKIIEGQNIYDYMPTSYPDAYSFVKAFAFANPSIMALGSPNDGISSFWKKWLTNLINTNQLQPNLSLDDFGVLAYNRADTYTTWNQLPMPDFMTNQSQVAVVQTLSDSPVTYPFLTNMFDRIDIQVFNNNTNASNLIFDTGMWRACDLHNRKLLIYTNTTTSVSLWMTSYRPGITATNNFQNFDTGSNAVCIQIAQTNIASTVTNFQVLITYERRDGTLVNPSSWLPSQDYFKGTTVPINCSRRDITAIIPGVARVTQPMLQVYAQDYWNLEQQKAANTNFVPAITAEAGDAVMILASSFFQKMWADDQFNQQIHKVHGLTWFSQGTAAMTPLSSSQMQVKLNMYWFVTYLIGNASLEQGTADWGKTSLLNYLAMVQAEGCSAEHSVIASVWGDQSPVSSIRLLQLAAQNTASNGVAGPMELNIENYNTLGNQSYTGYGSTLLKNETPSLWATVGSVYASEWDAPFVRTLITPGQVSNATGSFKGMAALIFGETETGATMSDNQTTLNGGYSDELDWMDTYDSFPDYVLTYNLDYSPSTGYTFTYNSLTIPQPQFYFSPYTALTMNSGGSGQTAQIAFTPQQTTQASQISAGLNLLSASTGGAIQAEKNTGWFGRAGAGIRQAGAMIAEPVQVVSGDFYSDTADMTLAGPMPLQLRRNYFSRNVADGEFGTGWKLSFTPWLVPTTNASNNQLLYAAEPDGAVLAYRYQTNNLWTIMPADNPDLVNFTASGIGGTGNAFNNTIRQNATNSGLYTLLGADGSQRTYQMMTNFAITAGTNQLSRVRPYLTLWQDAAGNYYQFSYGTNSANNNFGRLYRVQGANGASLTFEYDYYGRIIQVISDDDRIVGYQYDSYGDLTSVTLPDNTQWQYGYDHYSFTTNSQIYTDSDHLLISETKPDGRMVANTYDSLRRVIMQQATVGGERQLITNAWFFYTNNCTTLTNPLISGVTCVKDVFQNAYFYYYTNNLITNTIEPLGRTNIQSWYSIVETNGPGYYPNSLQYSVDARHLTNWFFYDSNGNVTNVTAYGNLTGNGGSGDCATNTFVYTSNSCPSTAIDPVGNQLSFFYNDPSDAYHLTDLQFSGGGAGIATNHWRYTNAVGIVNMGGWFETNRASGLCYQEILADTATNAWVYNGRGFPVQRTQYAATADLPYDSDPPVTAYFAFTPRGDLATITDALGRQVNMNYDEMGRLEWRDVFDQSSNVVSRENFYYTDNGELEWYDGPRSNPGDYIWFNYDGAGRKAQEIHWRTQAKADGSGIQAVSGNALYDTTFYAYDYFGNLTSTTDQRGASTTNNWDALGRLVQRQSFDVGGTALLATEAFAYEPGGLIQSYTNALGGLTTNQYTSTGRPQFRLNADGSTNGWTYYLDGRINREIQGNGAYWQSTYNDANRIVTRTFYSPAGMSEATNSFQFDTRGNPIQFVDAGGNSFIAAYDGLGRVKTAAGPTIVTINSVDNILTQQTTYTTNVSAQSLTNYFDAAASVTTNVNALGESTVSWFDVLGRVTQTEIISASGALIHQRSLTYSPDFNSVTIADGSGASAIVHTIYTDNDGQNVLDVAYPSANVTEFNLRQYDPAGNLSSIQHDSSSGGGVTTWATASFAYDGLNRPVSKYDRDNALTTYRYDPMGDLTNRTLPGGLQMLAKFNNAGQTLADWYLNTNSGAWTRSNSYSYFALGSPFAGLLQTKVDGRNTAFTYAYDDWLRTTSQTAAGSLPEQNLITAWQFDPRGYVTNYTEQFASTNTGPATSVQRAFDSYGQLVAESVNGGTYSETASQNWDFAGRRKSLNIGGASYNFSWQADGALTLVSNPTGTGTYTYDTAGILTSRLVGNRYTSITSRDGEARPLTIATTVNTASQLGETLAWSGDGLLTSHTLVRNDPNFVTDNRVYSYASQSRRLASEQLNLNTGTTWTNSFVYDRGVAGGPGALTTAGPTAASFGLWWSGVPDAFSRINAETNNAIGLLAFGFVNGQSTLTALLDNQPIQILDVGTNAMQWRTFVEFSQGAHQLEVNALHPSGFYTASATNTFTNNIVNQFASDTFDPAGNITNRVWINAGGATNRMQSLSFDAKGRLRQVIERNTNNYGFNWSAVYDGLDRRIATITTLVSNGVPSTVMPQTLDSYFDPQVEFLELGVELSSAPQTEFLEAGTSPSLQTVWKLYGPDADGVYGGLNGIGGLEGVSPYLNTFTPAISDFRGNILAEITNGVASWTLARPTAYSSVPGHRPVAFGNGVDLLQSSARLGREVDVTGNYHIGYRDLEAVSGQWLCGDPLGYTERDPNGYSLCGGDPVNYTDADGLIGKATLQTTENYAQGFNGFVKNTYFSMSYGLTTVTYGQNQANQWYGQNWQGLKQTVTGTAQTVYDTAAFASFELLSPIAPQQSAQSYGPSIDRLYGLDTAFTGGEANSAAYRTTATIANAGLFVLGGMRPNGEVAFTTGRINYQAIDSLGRPTGASATITREMLGTGTRASQSIIPPGYVTDSDFARGHLIGRQLGGSGTDARNLVTIFQNPANTPVMSGFEGQVRAAVQSGQTVNYSVVPVYQGVNAIPRGITIIGNGSGGFNLSVTVLNKGN